MNKLILIAVSAIVGLSACGKKSDENKSVSAPATESNACTKDFISQKNLLASLLNVYVKSGAEEDRAALKSQCDIFTTKYNGVTCEAVFADTGEKTTVKVSEIKEACSTI